MSKQDGRTLTPEALEERRRTIIRMKEQGYKTGAIVAATGCSRTTVYLLYRRWKMAGSRKKEAAVITVRKPGRKKGSGKTLTPSQEKAIQRIILEKYPEQLKFDFALWTREGVRLLVRRQFAIDMPIRTVGEYLKRWGFSPQKPQKYACERNPEKVKQWLETEYPRIKKRAKKQKAYIYWADETTIQAGDVRGRGYAPKGKTPTVRRTARRTNVSMVSAITSQGKVYWKLYEGSINSGKFLEFARHLIRNKRHKVFLILDNASPHRSLILKEWAAKNSGKIELNYLPPYSPDLNPDEHTNADVKQGVGARRPKKTKEELAAATEAHMRMLKRTPGRIVKYFKDPAISYAA